MLRLERVEIMGQLQHVGGPVGLRQHQAVRVRCHHRRQVGQGEPGIQGIDAHPNLGLTSSSRPVIHELGYQASRQRFVVRRHGIFEIEDQRVGAGAVGLGEFLLAVARNEQKRSQIDHDFGFRRCNPERLQEATNSLR